MAAMRERTCRYVMRAPRRNQIEARTMNGVIENRTMRHAPVHPEEHADDADEDEDVAEDGDEAGGEEVVERIDVGRDPRHETADGIAIEELQIEALQVPEDLLAQVVHDVLTHQVHQHHLRVENREPANEREEIERRRDVDALQRSRDAKPFATSHSPTFRLMPSGSLPTTGFTKRSIATAVIAGPAISKTEEMMTRTTDTPARHRYGRKYFISRHVRWGSKALAPSSSCFSISDMNLLSVVSCRLSVKLRPVEKSRTTDNRQLTTAFECAEATHAISSSSASIVCLR